MKTKLTLLLALAISAESATAARPNLPMIKRSALPSQAIRPAAKVPNIPMQRSNVLVPAFRPVVPMIKPSARPAPSSYLPKMPAIRPMVPQYVQPRSGGRSTSQRGSSAAPSAPAAIPGKSPASRNLPARPQVEIRKVVPGLNLPNAEGIRQGREIANGLQSIESLRGSISSLREFGDAFHQPGNSGPNDGANIFAPFGGAPGPDGNTEVHNPLDRSSNRGPRDIRGDMAKTRPADGSTGLSSTGDSVLESEISSASGSGGSSTPVQSTTEENGDVTASSTATTAGGATTSVEVTEHANGSGTTATTHGNDGRVDNLTVTRRDSSGAVVWSRSETVYPGGKAHVVTRDGSGRITSDTREYFLPRSSSCGINPAEGGALGGPGAPSAKQASGLIPLDLLRQFANGESTGGGTNYMTSPNGAVHVNPGNPNGNPEGTPGSGGSARRLKKDLFGTISNPGPHGGEGPLVGGNPPD